MNIIGSHNLPVKRNSRRAAPVTELSEIVFATCYGGAALPTFASCSLYWLTLVVYKPKFHGSSFLVTSYNSADVGSTKFRGRERVAGTVRTESLWLLSVHTLFCLVLYAVLCNYRVEYGVDIEAL